MDGNPFEGVMNREKRSRWPPKWAED
ncbi:uncharacterized protein G2W53_029227 [Senna tora]|uniref:Uncharacterized protein n=1 Tax=Senna tora TaxID=362788 RepID=A0A834T2L2_9FABA|nr:uncharacterized protein G2W53_029227 [Senna tora]